MSEAIVALNSVVETTDGVIADTGGQIGTMLADANAIIGGIKAGRGTVGQLVTDDTLYRRLTRAAVVRDDVVSRFRRKPKLVEVMPMSGDAKGSPRGDGRWSGVALALFVNNAALPSDR